MRQIRWSGSIHLASPKRKADQAEPQNKLKIKLKESKRRLKLYELTDRNRAYPTVSGMHIAHAGQATILMGQFMTKERAM